MPLVLARVVNQPLSNWGLAYCFLATTERSFKYLDFGFWVSHEKTAFRFSGGKGPVLVSCWMAERKFLNLLRYKEETTVSGQYQE